MTRANDNCSLASLHVLLGVLPDHDARNASYFCIHCLELTHLSLQVVLLSGFTLIRPNIPPWYIGVAFLSNPTHDAVPHMESQVLQASC